ncbi:response regulator, partial [Ralstonia mannitolilytica]|uniref:response regulator n=1 Tax=Ralstonia mannitolilytica TaxID=105219 RepID=UPI0029308B01
MRLLIVEDEPKAGDYLLKGLTESGFVADLARTGPDGLFQAMEHDYDLIVLDVMLPGMDGWQLIQELRRHKGRSEQLRPIARQCLTVIGVSAMQLSFGDAEGLGS